MRAKHVKEQKFYHWLGMPKTFFLVFRKQKKTTKELVVFYFFTTLNQKGQVEKLTFYPDDEINLKEIT
jgi:hypothetical protein